MSIFIYLFLLKKKKKKKHLNPAFTNYLVYFYNEVHIT